MENSKVQTILKKIAFSGLIFVFETFIPLLAGFEMIAAFFMHYIIYGLLYLFGSNEVIEFISIPIFFVLGAAFIVILHLLYHILIDGLFEIGLLIEMGIELFAVCIFYFLPDFILQKIVRNYRPGDELASFAKYMFLAAAGLYALFLAVFFTVRYFKKKKLKQKIKSLEDEIL
jgi:hypothetical protein